MPKMIIHAPKGTFDAEARERVAEALTDLGLKCEALPMTAFVKSTVWIYFNEYCADAVFMAGKPATAKIISLQVYVLEGGLDSQGKRDLIARATEILGRHSGARGRVPAYVVVCEVPEINWGIFGETGSLEALRASPENLPPL